jgi:hypothetical protein
MKAVVFAFSACVAAAQPLIPDAEFDLARLKPHRFSRSYISANPNGLTLVLIDQNNVLLLSADPGGRMLHSRSDLGSVQVQIDTALPNPNGDVWILSSSPYRLFETFGVGSGLGITDVPQVRAPVGRGSSQTTTFGQLDLYSPIGDHLAFLRLLSLAATPIAAGNDRLVLRSTGPPGRRTPQIVYFGTVADNRFKEETQVRIEPPVFGAISVLASNGNLVLISKDSGNMVVIDPTSKSGSVVRLTKPHRIRAAAADSGYIYLLSADTVLKTDSTGNVLSTYPVQVRGFVPSILGVTGNLLYLADNAGHVARFQL